MAYTTINKSTNYFETKLYVANQSQRNITGFNFNPDWVWIHNRTQSVNSLLFDKVRGATKQIHTNTTGAENTDAQALNAFITNGFSLGTGWGNQSTNDNYVSWNWSAGNSSGSSNTDGSITSTVSVNNTSKMSIVKYTGNGSDQTVGHGLGVVPSMIIVKCISATHDWVVYHQGMGNAKAIAFNNYNNEYSATAWQSYTPTNQVFYIKGGANSVSQSGDFIAYCFADVIGYQKCGTYIGNGNADGTFVYTGFKPAMVIVKSIETGTSNMLFDNVRDATNIVKSRLKTNATDIPATNINIMDFRSNGFQLRVNDSSFNTNGHQYMYFAFAESPFVSSTGTPTTAR